MRRLGPFSLLRRALGACAVATILAVLATPAAALEIGMQSRPAVMTSAAVPNRQAVIIAPSAGGGIAADVEAYVETLRLLGFEVTTILSDSRPQLDSDLRRFATGVKSDGEVVVLVLGTVLAQGKDLYVTPAPPTDDLMRRPELYATEGVGLANALRRILQRGPKDVVTLVDACRAATGSTDCKQTPEGLPEGVSAIVAYRSRGDHAKGPLARVGSVRSNAVALMRREGLSFFAFYDALKKDLRGTDMELAATPLLSRSFVFLPSDFFARLPTPCNEVSVWTSEETLRARPLDRIVAACEEAARTYDFSPYFKDNLSVVREQDAFRDAVASCADLRSTDAYLQTYPQGAYRKSVERHKAKCKAAETKPPPPPPPPPPTARLVPRGNQPASFACQAYMREPVAQLICADRDLAAADWRLGITYKAAMMSRGQAARRALVSEEAAWLERRTKICGIPILGQWDPSELARFKDCLLGEINRRAHEIEQNL